MDRKLSIHCSPVWKMNVIGWLSSLRDTQKKWGASSAQILACVADFLPIMF